MSSAPKIRDLIDSDDLPSEAPSIERRGAGESARFALQDPAGAVRNLRRASNSLSNVGERDATTQSIGRRAYHGGSCCGCSALPAPTHCARRPVQEGTQAV